MESFDYTILKDFCAVRNLGNANKNGIEYTPRMVFIMNFLDTHNIPYHIDAFDKEYGGLHFFDSEKYLLDLSVEELEEKLSEADKNIKELQRKIVTDGMLYNRHDFHEDFVIHTSIFILLEKAIVYKKFSERGVDTKYFNIVVPGTSETMFLAHHDVSNPNIDNCNDNSASIINLLALKLLKPDTSIVFTDCEEIGGYGAKRLSEQLKNGEHGNIKWVLNLELTAVGGTNFIIGKKRNSLYEYMVENFVFTPFDDTYCVSDSTILTRNGIQSCVVTTLPLKNGKSDFDIIKYCHGSQDTIELANYQDMQNFVEMVLTKMV